MGADLVGMEKRRGWGWGGMRGDGEGGGCRDGSVP